MSDPKKRSAPDPLQGDVVLCCLVERLATPHVPSEQRECSLCTKAVWLALASIIAIKAHGIEASIVCENCFLLLGAETHDA